MTENLNNFLDYIDEVFSEEQKMNKKIRQASEKREFSTLEDEMDNITREQFFNDAGLIERLEQQILQAERNMRAFKGDEEMVEWWKARKIQAQIDIVIAKDCNNE